eukprot:2994828-Pleurochrysis_carterae.AAC.1
MREHDALLGVALKSAPSLSNLRRIKLASARSVACAHVPSSSHVFFLTFSGMPGAVPPSGTCMQMPGEDHCVGAPAAPARSDERTSRRHARRRGDVCIRMRVLHATAPRLDSLIETLVRTACPDRLLRLRR